MVPGTGIPQPAPIGRAAPAAVRRCFGPPARCAEEQGHDGLCVSQIPGVRFLCAGKAGHAEAHGDFGVAIAAAAAESGPRQL